MTIRQVSYSNTFSEWMIVTNQAVALLNQLSNSDFYKANGTLFLTTLDVSGKSIFNGDIYANGKTFIANAQIENGFANNFTVSNGKFVTLTTKTLHAENAFLSNTITISTANINILNANTATLKSVTVTGNNIVLGDSISYGNTIHLGGGYLKVPSGPGSQRPVAPGNGAIRYNSSNSTYEGFSTTSGWNSFSSTVGPGGQAIFHQNDKELSSNFSLPNSKNYMCAGPIKIASGVILTIENGTYISIV